MLLVDEDIKKAVEKYGLITPFVAEKVSEGVMSYGLGAFGYDFRLGENFKVPDLSIKEPKNIREEQFSRWNTVQTGQFWLNPNSYVLGQSVELFNMPADLFGICLGKSTYARCGIVVNVTPLEPGWRGQLTIEINNCSRTNVRIYPGEGIAQVIFFLGYPKTSYLEHGKYCDSMGVVLPKV